jgi:AraC-like DNA-binding protein
MRLRLMIMNDFNSQLVKEPLDFFKYSSTLSNAKIIEEEGQFLYFISDNALCKEIVEYLPFGDGCYAINKSGFYYQEHSTTIQFQYATNWLKIIIQNEPNTSLLIIVRFSQAEYRHKYHFSLIDDVSITWKQLGNSTDDRIILFLSDKWLLDTLNFIPNLAENNWQPLIDIIKGREMHEISKPNLISELTTTILNDIAQKDSDSVQKRRENLNQLSHEIINMVLGDKYSMWSNSQKMDLQMVILAEKELIKDFKKAPLTLDELAKIAGMNRQKFQKVFKEYFEKPFFQYYQEARFIHAKELIEKKGYNVSEAAYQIGFKNVSYFSRYFVKYFGIKPSEIKKQM